MNYQHAKQVVLKAAMKKRSAKAPLHGANPGRAYLIQAKRLITAQLQKVRTGWIPTDSERKRLTKQLYAMGKKLNQNADYRWYVSDLANARHSIEALDIPAPRGESQRQALQRRIDAYQFALNVIKQRLGRI